ncbi:hypothetical protein [Coleofasciculus sp. E1-EBD-02]|uniref:hypothetical protein n=1 Tax=Coleofasciculus sp. E1-EBD-02 TaxID=3068481 RepID=UPI0032F51E9D
MPLAIKEAGGVETCHGAMGAGGNCSIRAYRSNIGISLHLCAKKKIFSIYPQNRHVYSLSQKTTN